MDESYNRKTRDSFNRMSERYLKRKNGRKTSIFSSFVKDDDGNIDYPKWLVVFILFIMSCVLFVYAQSCEDKYCNCVIDD